MLAAASSGIPTKLSTSGKWTLIPDQNSRIPVLLIFRVCSVESLKLLIFVTFGPVVYDGYIECIKNISLMNRDIDQYWPGIKDGDEKVFEKLFKETYPSLCYYTKQITRDSHLAEEIVQDIFQKIWQRRDTIIITSSFKSYLFQSVRNLALDSVKKKSSRRLSFSSTVSEESWQYILETFKSDDYIIEKIITGETEKSIRTVINSLPPQCSTVFLKSFEDNIPINDIALQLKISPSTVRVHIHNALIKIKEFLQKEE